MSDTLSEGAEVKVNKKVVETVEAVLDIQQMYLDDDNDANRGVTVREVGKKLKLDDSPARRRLYAAEARGLIQNLDPRGRGHAALYRTTTAAYDLERPTIELLPTPDALRAAIREKRGQ